MPRRASMTPTAATVSATPENIDFRHTPDAWRRTCQRASRSRACGPWPALSASRFPSAARKTHVRSRAWKYRSAAMVNGRASVASHAGEAPRAPSTIAAAAPTASHAAPPIKRRCRPRGPIFGMQIGVSGIASLRITALAPHLRRGRGEDSPHAASSCRGASAIGKRSRASCPSWRARSQRPELRYASPRRRWIR